jgi:hypothetical protein
MCKDRILLHFYIRVIQHAQGIYDTVLHLNVVCSKDVFETLYEDFIKYFYSTQTCRKSDAHPFVVHKTGAVVNQQKLSRQLFFHGVRHFNRLTFGWVCNSFTPYLDLTTSDFFFIAIPDFSIPITSPSNNSLIIRISNFRPISRSKTLQFFF